MILMKGGFDLVKEVCGKRSGEIILGGNTSAKAPVVTAGRIQREAEGCECG
jgi:hypothetical protein